MDTRENLYKEVQKAMEHALREGIKANSMVINTNMVKVPATWIHDGVGGAIQLPPMICGLDVYCTKNELPEGYSFAIFEGHPNRLKQFESIGMEPDELRKAAEMYRKIKEVIE